MGREIGHFGDGAGAGAGRRPKNQDKKPISAFGEEPCADRRQSSTNPNQNTGSGDSGRSRNAKRLRSMLLRAPRIHDVEYAVGSQTVQVKTSVAGFMGMLDRVHHTAGFYREQAVTDWWAAFVALISAALLTLGATGLYMWFRLHRERMLGGIFLSIGLFVGLGLLIATRIQP
jgi:hypothetical protein